MGIWVGFCTFWGWVNQLLWYGGAGVTSAQGLAVILLSMFSTSVTRLGKRKALVWFWWLLANFTGGMCGVGLVGALSTWQYESGGLDCFYFVGAMALLCTPLGFAQALVLRALLGVRAMVLWVVASVIGGILAVFIATYASVVAYFTAVPTMLSAVGLLPYQVTDLLLKAILAALGGLVFGLSQSIVLWADNIPSGRWAVVNAFAWAMGLVSAVLAAGDDSVIWVLSARSPGNDPSDIVASVSMIIASSAITGLYLILQEPLSRPETT